MSQLKRSSRTRPKRRRSAPADAEAAGSQAPDPVSRPEALALPEALEAVPLDDGPLVPDLLGSEDGHSLEPVLDVPALSAAGAATEALVPFDPLSRYLAEIRRYSPIEREEELRLARVFRETRDPDAAARLVTANLVLVVKIARLFRRAVVNVLDLIQEGNVGLIQALDRFDPEVGVRFSTYAAWWVRAYILKYLLDNVRMVRVGTTNARRRLLYNLHREKRRLEAAGFSVGPKLLAETFGVSEKDVVEVQQSLAGGDVSLDAPVGDDGEQTRGDFVPSPAPSVEDEVAEQEIRGMIEEKLSAFRAGLASRDVAILDGRLLADEPLTLQQIGEQFSITREAVRQAEKRLTGRLKEYLGRELGEEVVLRFGVRRRGRN